MRGGTPDCGIGTTADQERNRRIWCWLDEGVFKLEELAVVADFPAAHQSPQCRERVVGLTPAFRWIDAADLHFVAIFAADPDPQYNPAGC